MAEVVVARSREVSNAIFSCMSTLDNLMKTPIFDQDRATDPMFTSAMVLALVNMKDLLKIADAEGNRVSFKDDVGFVFGKPSDVTTLICEARDAACHSSSLKRYIGNARISACVMSGLCPRALNINGILIGCNYADDHCIVYGQLQVYVKRHFLRAFSEVKVALGVENLFSGRRLDA